MNINFSILCFFVFTASLVSSDEEAKSSETTRVPLLTVSSESNEAEDRNEGRGIIGTIQTIKRVGDILQTVGGKILPSNLQVPTSSEFGRPKARAIQIIHDLKNDVLAKNKSK